MNMIYHLNVLISVCDLYWSLFRFLIHAHNGVCWYSVVERDYHGDNLALV